MSRTRCGQGRPNSSSRGGMPIAASAAMKSAASAPRRSAPPPANPKAASGRTSGGSTTDAASGRDIEAQTPGRGANVKRIHYSKYPGEDLGIDPLDLLNALTDFQVMDAFHVGSAS